MSLLRRWRQRSRSGAAVGETFAGLVPVVLITGASDGIGRAFARRLAAEGRTLLLIARHAPKLEQLASELRAVSKGTIAVLAVDLSTSPALDLVSAALANLHGYADFLVNNAGVGLAGPFAEADADAVDALLALNVTAATRLARYVLPGMLARECGGILFVASLAAYAPGPWQAVYYASKAYLLSLSEALAAENAASGVRICCIAPGPVETGFHAKMRAEHAVYRLLLPSQSPDRVAALGLLAYRAGFRVLVPGLMSTAFAMAIRLLPHRITLPIVGFLMCPRPLRSRVADAK